MLFLLLVVTMFCPTLKVLISLRGEKISKLTHAVSANGIKIATIGKDSIPVSIIDIVPANALIHRKASSFEHLVRTVSTLKGLHTS